MNGKKGNLVVLLSVCFLMLTCVGETMGFTLNMFKTNTPAFKAQDYDGIPYRFSEPKNYNGKVEDGMRYPLVVFLHGAGERGFDNKRQSLNLSYLGNGHNRQAELFRENHPCFVFVPQCPRKRDWSGDILTDLTNTIEYLIEKYPIDRSQLYFIGYSMGGSGVYSLAGTYYKQTGYSVAAIIRMAGQSSFDPQFHEIIGRSAVWLHIGLEDTALRVEKAREAYSLLKKNLRNPSETREKGTLDGVEFETRTLSVEGREQVKLTEYTGMGHGINLFPFKDNAVLSWLFNQRAIVN